MKNKINPVLIIGTQRSGSNLLRLMLNQLPQIEAPHPPHILQIFSPFVSAYGKLEEPDNFSMLAGDISRFMNANPVPWRNMTLEAGEIIDRCKIPSLVEVFKAVYEMKAEGKKASYWCCKSMANVYHIPEIEASGMKPFYIHLLRDGRDVAASFKNAIVGEKHLYFIAKQWDKEQRLAAEMMAKFASERSVLLKYEDFIADPESALKPVLTRLGLNWTEEILQYYLSEEAKTTAAAGEMWRNVIKPVDRTNMRHYSEKLSKEEIAMFESLAGNTLAAFGYKCDNYINNNEHEFTRKEILSFSEQNERLKKEARAKFVKDAHAREKQEGVLREIKSRLGV